MNCYEQLEFVWLIHLLFFYLAARFGCSQAQTVVYGCSAQGESVKRAGPGSAGGQIGLPPPGGPRGTETQPRPRAEPPSCLLTHT